MAVLLHICVGTDFKKKNTLKYREVNRHSSDNKESR